MKKVGILFTDNDNDKCCTLYTIFKIDWDALQSGFEKELNNSSLLSRKEFISNSRFFPKVSDNGKILSPMPGIRVKEGYNPLSYLFADCNLDKMHEIPIGLDDEKFNILNLAYKQMVISNEINLYDTKKLARIKCALIRIMTTKRVVIDRNNLEKYSEANNIVQIHNKDKKEENFFKRRISLP